MKYTVGEMPLFYEKTGTGPALFLLHGNGEDHHIFDPLAAQLQQKFTIYAVDSRGHGQSGAFPDFSYDTMAEDMYGLISALAPQGACLAGFSDGAIIGLLLAMKYPKLLQKAALLGVNLSPGDFKPENLLWLQEEYAKTGAPLMRLMLEQPQISLEETAAVDIPVLVAAGEDDLFRETLYPSLAAALPRGSLYIFSGETHDSYLQKPDVLAPVLRGFFV